MTQLYTTLAHIYHEMYQHVFDYDQEFWFYDSILKDNNCKKILEIGCGTGILADKFIKNGYDYLGMDLFNEMLEIARSETKTNNFVQCDMRNISFERRFDAVLITGRSIAYVIDNKGVTDTLSGINKSLKDKGLLVLGIFEANSIFDNLNGFEQTIELNDKRIRRINKLEKNLETGWTYNWYAKYIIEKDDNVSEFEDTTTLRAFTRDEFLLFLKLTDFTVKEVIEEAKTMTFIAQKNSQQVSS